MEAALVTALIGLCAVATLQLMAAGTQSNDQAAEMTTALNLAGNLRDATVGLPLFDPDAPTSWVSRESTVAAYDNVTDFDGQTYSPPLDARRVALSGYPNWSQAVAVQSVSEDGLTTVKAPSTSDKTARVTITVRHVGRVVYQTSWVVADTTGG